jgi:hypothetical protein
MGAYYISQKLQILGRATSQRERVLYVIKARTVNPPAPKTHHHQNLRPVGAIRLFCIHEWLAKQ